MAEKPRQSSGWKTLDFELKKEEIIAQPNKQYSLFTINFLLDKEPRKTSSDEFNSSDEDHIDVESRSASSGSLSSSTNSCRPSVIKLDGLKCDDHKKGKVELELNLIQFALFLHNVKIISPVPFFFFEKTLQTK